MLTFLEKNEHRQTIASSQLSSEFLNPNTKILKGKLLNLCVLSAFVIRISGERSNKIPHVSVIVYTLADFYDFLNSFPPFLIFSRVLNIISVVMNRILPILILN